MTTYTNNGTGTFSSASNAIRRHVLDDYLAAKIANHLGIRRSDVNDGTVIQVPANYANSEGVISGMELVKGLRVDLQRAQATTVIPTQPGGCGGAPAATAKPAVPMPAC